MHACNTSFRASPADYSYLILMFFLSQSRIIFLVFLVAGAAAGVEGGTPTFEQVGDVFWQFRLKIFCYRLGMKLVISWSIFYYETDSFFMLRNEIMSLLLEMLLTGQRAVRWHEGVGLILCCPRPR